MSAVQDALTSLQNEIDSLNSQVSDASDSLDNSASGLDDFWHLIAGTFVFFMQAGFAMLEAGSVRSKNAVNVLFKNLIDGAISAMFFWILGFGFAYGDTAGGFVGYTRFGLADNDFDLGDGAEGLNYHTFFFQWSFAATAATIVSGCVAERCKLEAYFVYSAVLACWVYPVVVHWAWGEGWLSPFGSDTSDYLFKGKESNNFVDFAGSGVVHAVGGFTGLVAAMILGPRKGRFVDGEVQPMAGHSAPLVMLGTVILWVGWYGFNPGSTLCIVGDCAKLASKVAVVTTIAAASSALTMVGYQTFIVKVYDLGMLSNSVLAGLVAVTAPCAVIEPWGAMLIGIAGCIVYVLSSKALLHFQIDDPLDASPIHGFCGVWGCLAVGIFGNDDNAAFAGYNGSANGYHPFRTGEQFGVQLVGIIVIILWTLLNAVVLFFAIKYTVGLRVDAETEDGGLDTSEHGVNAYTLYEKEPGVNKPEKVSQDEEDASAEE